MTIINLFKCGQVFISKYKLPKMNERWITPGTQLVVLAIFVEPMLCLFYDTRVFPADDRDQLLNWTIMINCVGTRQKFLLLSSTAHFIHQYVWRVPWTPTKDGVIIYFFNTSTRHKSTTYKYILFMTRYLLFNGYTFEGGDSTQQIGSEILCKIKDNEKIWGLI